VANLFHKWGKILIKKVQGAQFLIENSSGGQNSAILAQIACLSHLKKSLRAISKAQAGQKWPAGHALAAPDLRDNSKNELKCTINAFHVKTLRMFQRWN
jgi:hypothetical protein